MAIRDALLRAPAWAVGGILPIVAVGTALAVRRGDVDVLRWTFGRRHPFLRTLFHDTKSPMLRPPRRGRRAGLTRA